MYKKLKRIKNSIWFGKRENFRKFERKKWEGFKLVSNKYKFFNQDIVSAFSAKTFKDTKFSRIRKVYRYLLRDKQKLQLYFDRNRLKHFQLKTLSLKALKISYSRDINSSTSFLYLLDTRLKNILYRLGFLSTIVQTRKLIYFNHVKVNTVNVSFSSFFLKDYDFIYLDPGFCSVLKIWHLKNTFPLTYLKRKRWCYKKNIKQHFLFFKGFLRNEKSYQFTVFYFNRLKNSLFIDHNKLISRVYIQ
uniref:Ribosomal protein S4 n=1 Tax=Vischeria stellata TaxID=1104407 RepID=A0A481XG92_9STRA|nr:ribosomal protein S4 [Vischeria stellata]QBK36853.1 ribosomal protein S4 [Vischeria stellata]